MTDTAIKNHEELWPGYIPMETDPELMEFFGNWAFDEVTGFGNIDSKTRVMMILASTIADGAMTEFGLFVNAALNVAVTPVEIKEIVYHAIPYVGVARTVEFLIAANKILTENGAKLPLENQSTTTPENRYESGLEIQKKLYADQIDKMDNLPANQLHFLKFLTANCFGDYYTRKGLDLQTKELLTFSMLATMGNQEPELKAHIQGNLNVGNTVETLISVLTQLLPYIGYPRTFSALKCLNEINA